MTRFALTAAAVIVSFLAAAPPGWAAWTWPLRGEVLTQYRNGDDPYAGGQHRGIDIGGDVGSPVVAATPGEVRFAGVAGVSGLTVSLRTADGRYDTSYLHLSAVSVRKGDTVAAGDRLGAVGTSGTRSAAAPHLHFGVRDADSSQSYHDPLGFLPPVATTGLPHPGAPTPVPEAVPSVPAPRPGSEPVPAAGRTPGPARAPRAVPGRARVRGGASVPAGSRGGARAPVGSRGGTRGTAGARPAPAGSRGDARARAPHAPGRSRRVPNGQLAAQAGPGGVSASASPAISSTGSTETVGSAGRALLGGDGSAARRDAGGRDPSAAEGAHGRSRPAGHAAHRARGDRGAGGGASPARGDLDTGAAVAAVDGAGRSEAPLESRSTGADGGPDAGWALACLALLLAAALVGTSGGVRDFVKRRGVTLGRALRPLLGRG